MTAPTLTRLAATTAVATIAVTAAVTASASATTRSHTSLSIRSAKSTVTTGGHDTISGVLLADCAIAGPHAQLPKLHVLELRRHAPSAREELR